MRHSLMIAVSLLTGCLSACTKPPAILPVTAPVTIPNIDPLTLYPVQWQVMTLPQLKQLVAEMEASPSNKAVWYILDKPNYDNLSLNLIGIERFTSEQKAILDMLKTIIERREAAQPTQ